MASLFYTLDLLEIGRYKLNLNEYLTLLKFQHDSEGRTFPFVPDERFYPRLSEEGYIVITPTIVNGVDTVSISLGPKGISLFEGDEDLFEEFFALFPSSVDTGFGKRAISAKDPNSISGKITHDIWKRITKKKPDLQRKIINNLKRELEYRKSDGSLAYLQGIDTWLRQATWEKWDDIPDKRSSGNNYVKL